MKEDSWLHPSDHGHAAYLATRNGLTASSRTPYESFLSPSPAVLQPYEVRDRQMARDRHTAGALLRKLPLWSFLENSFIAVISTWQARGF